MAHPNSSSNFFGLIGLFVRHPNASNLLMSLMILFGVFSLGLINTSFFPLIKIPDVTVTISWSGSSAEDVERNILDVVEPELRFLDGVDRLTSSAREGLASIRIEYEEGTDSKDASREVETVLRSITTLPEGSESPVVRPSSTHFDLIGRLAIYGDVPERALRHYAKRIRDDLLERGIAKVTFSGFRDREFHIDVPERHLRRFGMTVSDISGHITSNSRDLPSGRMEGEIETQLRALSQGDSVDDLEDLEIRSFLSGEKVFLGDISDISDSYDSSQPQGFIGSYRSIQINIDRSASADTLESHAIFEDYVEELRGWLPEGVFLSVYNVRAEALTERILLLLKNGLSGLVLVILVLFLFLDRRIAFWVAAGIPVSMLATIGVMWMMGMTINMISLFAMIMMLGIIVDDAIVVGEHTATRCSLGDDPATSALNGAQQMVRPISAAMLTTLCAFGPILVVKGPIGQIMGVMPVVVISVIIASLLECFLVLPGHLSHSLSRRRFGWSYFRQLTTAIIISAGLLSLSNIDARFGGFFGLLRDSYGIMFYVCIAFLGYIASHFFERFFSRLHQKTPSPTTEQDSNDTDNVGSFRRSFDSAFVNFRDGPFKRLVSLSFHWRYVTIALSVSSVMIGVIGLLGSQKVNFSFFPSPESDRLTGRIVFNAGLPESEAIAAMKRVSDALAEAERTLTNGEERLVLVRYSTYGSAGRTVSDSVASIGAQLTISEERSIRTPKIVRAWRRAIPPIPGVRRVSVSATRGGPPGRDLDIELRGDDIRALKQAATEMIPIIESVPGASGVSDNLPYGKPELVMSLTPRGRALGFTVDSVGRQLRDSFDGSIARRFADGDDEVTIRVSQVMRSPGLSALRNFELRGRDNSFIPLSDIVTLTERQGFGSIQRVDSRATVSITGDLDLSLNTTGRAIDYLESSGIGDVASRYGVEYEYSGRDEERRKAFSDLRIGVLMALSSIYIILAWTFGSYWLPFAVMAIIPFGSVGSVIGHYLFGLPMTILSYIGLLGLSGILVNNSIILVARLESRLSESRDLASAAIGASCDRLRAVLLTSLTTIGGLVPLLFETSFQAQFLKPMVITMVFGLGVATMLVLFLVPALIGVGSDISGLTKNLFTSSRSEERVSPAR